MITSPNLFYCSLYPQLYSRPHTPLPFYFLPLPASAWLRCEIILLLGGFPAICHCHLLAQSLERGSLFQKNTPRCASPP